MPLWLSGIGVSRGIVIGRVHRMQGDDFDIPEYGIEAGEIESEISRYYNALKETRAHLREIRERIPASVQTDIASFIDTHLLMLEDQALTEAVSELIRERQCNAEWALRLQRDNLTAVFEEMDDAYLRSRRDDVEHVVASILRVLLNQQRNLGEEQSRSLQSNDQPIVLVADNVTPADIILLQQQGVDAFITEFGGPLSHTAILAKSLGLAAIVGLHHARRYFRDGETIIVDGEAGHAVASPDESALAYYEHCQQRDERYRRMLGRLRDTPAVSADKRKITLLGNIELPGDTRHVIESGAEGVGLFRTEFLYMNRDAMPGEDEQLDAYLEVVRATPGPVTIRTLDLGADKQVDSGRTGVPASNNPALGLRAIRLCLKEQDLFRVQLRALLRASAEGQVHIMLPMISNLQEMRQARQLIEQTRGELLDEGHKVADNIPIGAMIEVPAAALAAPMLARHADFFSIGTNDLIQYTLAIDRVDDEVNYLYDPLHPAVLRLIRMTIEAGEQAGIPVAMCGEMASDRRYTRLLLGLGLTEFSMHPASVLEVKQIILNSDIGALTETARRALNAVSASELHELLMQLEQSSTPTH